MYSFELKYKAAKKASKKIALTPEQRESICLAVARYGGTLTQKQLSTIAIIMDVPVIAIKEIAKIMEIPIITEEEQALIPNPLHVADEKEEVDA